MIAPRFRRLTLIAVVGVGLLGLSACSNTVSDAATVTYTDAAGSHTIHVTRADFKKQLGGLLHSAQFRSFLTTTGGFTLVGDQENTTGTQLSSSYLSQLVEQSAIDAEFASLKLTITADERSKAVDETKQQFPLQNEIGQDSSGNQTFVGPGAVYLSLPKWLQTILVDRTARLLALGDYYTSASTGKQKALYDEFAKTICPSGRTVAQIQVADAATASSILAQLQGGASFADLAKTKSKDATSAKLGGIVGCLSSTTVAKAFEEAAFKAPFGVPIGPVQTNLGYHVILVTRASFDDVRAQLTAALQQNPFIARDLRLQSMHVWVNPQFGSGALAVDSQHGSLLFHITGPKAPTPRVCREKSALCTGTTTTTVTTVPTGIPSG